MADHWFDTLNKALVWENPRRTLLGAAAAAVTSLGLIAQPESALGKKGKKHKQKGKHNGKKKYRNKNGKSKVTPLLCHPYMLEACNVGPSFVSGDPKACEDTCERCQQEETAFCLVPTGDDVYPRQPTCCYPADECCGDANFGFGDCCTSDRCCDAGDGGRFCAPPGEHCCRNGIVGTCPYGQECCGGRCVASCVAPLVLDPVSCECVDLDTLCRQHCVGPDLACCHGNCVNTRTDNGACGGCDRPCLGGRVECCDGACVDVQFNNAHCGGNCLPCPAGQECCHFRCIDPQVQRCCRDELHGEFNVIACSTVRNEVCCTHPNGFPGCCPP
jgi:hypothetical protein